MTIGICNDHAGLECKTAVVECLLKKGRRVVNFGTDSPESCDYPDFVGPAAQAVAAGEFDRGIVLCTTGIGVSITANKVKGIRCALLSDVMSARLHSLVKDNALIALTMSAWSVIAFSSNAMSASCSPTLFKRARMFARGVVKRLMFATSTEPILFPPEGNGVSNPVTTVVLSTGIPVKSTCAVDVAANTAGSNSL